MTATVRCEAARVYVPFREFNHLQSFKTLAAGLPLPGYRKKTHRRLVMARLIEFYIPARFHKPVKWIPTAERGKVLEFRAEMRKSA